MRKPIVAGNWKMHKTNSEVEQFIKELGELRPQQDLDLVICAPFTALSTLVHKLHEAELDIQVGAQNMHFEEKGAYTGEISGSMLKELGVSYVIIGHSERRTLFLEDLELIQKKVEAAYKYDLTPILCVGETLAEREAGKTQAVVCEQTVSAVKNLTSEQVRNLVIAYEPVWAIGTGKTSSAEEANEVIAYIRRVIADQFDQQVANEVRIQYGGSVKPDNIATFLAQSDIDGALVGGASLEASSFMDLAAGVGGATR